MHFKIDRTKTELINLPYPQNLNIILFLFSPLGLTKNVSWMKEQYSMEKN